ncbi:MAG: SAM-dependent methyltransferase [Cyanobacteria bacterium J06635_1]
MTTEPTPDSELLPIVANQIDAAPQQQISFAEFMELVLYHPKHGYYASKAAIFGPQGDFITSPHWGHDFGELLAVQFADLWNLLERPQPFQLVEMGAGQGLVAADVLSYLQRHHPDCFAALEYTIVEKSAALKADQQQRLAPWQAFLQWTSLDEIAPITGCIFSNELVDAFPVHLVEKRQGQLWEVFVANGDGGVEADEGDGEGRRGLRRERSAERDAGTRGRGDGPSPITHHPLPITHHPSPITHFTEVLAPVSTPQINEYFALVGIDLLSGQYPDGYRTEVNLAALDWVAAIAAKLHRGYVLTIDYGHLAHRYYSPARRSGTLKCYYQHRHHDNPYLYMGEQDITAHVDFTALEKQGQPLGLEKVGFTQQALFLMALGIGDRMAALSQARSQPQAGSQQTLQSLLQRRETLRQLIDPMGLGNFGVLLQSKAVENPQLPKGFQEPEMASSRI